MTIETRKIKIAQSVLGNLSEETIQRMEELIRLEKIEKIEMEKRALESEQNIKEGKLHTLKEAQLRIEKSLNQ